MTPKQAELLTAALPAGWMRRVREMLATKGLHHGDAYISRVRNAHKQNADIEEALLQVVEEEAQRRRAVTERIQSAVEQ